MNPRVSLALAHWPDADRKMWDMLTRGGGPLDDLGALSHLKPVSLEGCAAATGSGSLGFKRKILLPC